jgi:hypothetical protein
MKRKKVMEYTKKLTPRQLALVELKTPERPNGPITLTDFIQNYLMPRMDAKKRRVVVFKGKVSDVFEFPDPSKQLEALCTVAWMMGLYPKETRMPAELKDIEFIIEDTPRSEVSTANRPTPEKGSTGSGS